jgi:hypothetical protein
MWIGLVLLMVAGGILIGVASYHAGVNHGIAQAANSDKVGGFGYGGFPFGFLIFPLVIFGIFAIAAGARRRRWAAMGGGPGWGGPGRWGFDQERVAEMHRQLHEQDGDHPGVGGEPSRA